MRELLLGLDIGTSACKAAVFHSDGEVIATESKSFPMYHPERGYAEQDPNDWWNAVSYCTRKIFADKNISPHEISAIGIDGQSWAAVPVDKEGVCLCNSPLWMDTRTKDICNDINNKIGARNIFSISGNPLKPGYTTPKVIWYKKNLPEIYSRISKILQSNGYIAFRLTDELTQDISQGYGWHCFDMRKGTWSYDMARELGIDTRFLPEIVPCDKVIGGVTKTASLETGLIEGTPVVAGGLDAACSWLQSKHGVLVVRRGGAFWADFNHYLKCLERHGCRAIVFGQSHEDRDAWSGEFYRLASKDVIISNAIYGHGWEYDKIPRWKQRAWDTFEATEKAGFTQFPCASNWVMKDKVPQPLPTGKDYPQDPEAIAWFVKFCRERIDPSRLMGFMVAPWGEINPALQYYWESAIDQLDEALKGDRT